MEAKREQEAIKERLAKEHQKEVARLAVLGAAKIISEQEKKHVG
jgi:F0F1-type ATP synthase membrane subunit b/b'